MRIHKKFLHTIAALWILLFHLWLPMTGLVTEQYLVKIGYVGVDLFFFTAAYTLAGREISYLAFLKNRFGQIYLRYAFFVFLASAVGGFDLLQLLSRLSGVELFLKGGGAFLWFLPAILLFYLLYPLFLQWKQPWKYPTILAAWAVFSLLSQYVFGYTEIFIFTNRIPLLLLGEILQRYRVPQWLALPCIPAGAALLYFWGFTGKLHLPWYSFYLVLALVLTVGLAGVSAYVPDWKIWKLFGSATMEIYALQMIFGPMVVSWCHRITDNLLLTNLLMLLLFWGASIGLSQLYMFGMRWIRRRISA